MPWWAPLGGLVGAVQVYAGLTLVNKVGAGPFVGLTVSLHLWRLLRWITLVYFTCRYTPLMAGEFSARVSWLRALL